MSGMVVIQLRQSVFGNGLSWVPEEERKKILNATFSAYDNGYSLIINSDELAVLSEPVREHFSRQCDAVYLSCNDATIL